ncbi:MAG: type VI secretion system baseplate subunit TssG [Desulfatiglandales bacterium]
MAAKKRQSDTPLRDRIFEEYYRFSFFEAVRLMEAMYPEKKPIGEALTPDNEPVRFSVKPGFSFPPSEIAGLRKGKDGEAPEMDVAFLGLIGPSGVLPHWYNELAVERVHDKDFGLTHFLDIFHHRLISLFYLGWKKNQFPANYLPGARDRLSWYLKSLIGLGMPSLTDRIGFAEESLVFYSGLLSRSVPSAAALEVSIAYFSGTTVQIEQFVDRMLPLSPEDQTALGMANNRLGLDTVCGSYVWECQSKFRVNLGPMSYADYLRFLPSGDLLGPIFALITYMVGLEFEFDVRVFLKREEVPPCILGKTGRAAPRLGWTTWVKSPDVKQKKDPYMTFEQKDGA